MTERARDDRLPRPLDVALVLPIIAAVILGTVHRDVEAGERAIDAVAYATGIVGAGSLAFWRRWSSVVTGIVAITTAVYVARGYDEGPALLPGPLALLALGYTTPRRIGWIGTAGYVAAAVAARLWAGDLAAGELLLAVGWASAAVLAGQAIAARGERAAAQRERREHAHEQALARERLRIAQDLHDSVAHAMATINVQSGVAGHLLDRDPSQAGNALEAIRTASSKALDELNAILGVLRDPETSAPREPLGSLAHIDDLVTRASADGLDVTATVAGKVEAIAPSISAAGYRVVQEALTNARRHAGSAASAAVDVTVGEDGAVSIRVTDRGGTGARPHNNSTAGGFGLLGMRERVESTGGSLVAGPGVGGGWEVRAEWAERT
jgi:signal transduction histidine kinase